MDIEQIAVKIAEFERNHPVDQFQCLGWHPWPHIRQRIRFDLAGEPHRPMPRGLLRRWALRARGAAQHALEPLRRGADRMPGRTRSGAVILTYAGREIPRVGRQYHTVIDPAVAALRARGIRAEIWEVGNPPQPRWEQSIPISSVLRRACRTHQLCGLAPPLTDEPIWFGDIARWMRSEMGVTIDWADWGAGIRHIDIRASVMEQWLRQSQCRALFVDCWYNHESQAASLAAHRLGIPAIDIQHGLHDLLYHTWMKCPDGGYENMPTGYWVWGPHFADALLESSPGIITHDCVFEVGNLWLDLWRGTGESDLLSEIRAARAARASHPVAILVTLQRGIDLEDTLQRLIAASPPDWLWLIRPHRQTRGTLEMLASRCRASGHPNVNFDDAVNRPLYALLSAVDAHVTGFSTCAMEALAFGKPTVLLHPNGPILYPDAVQRGAMFPADGPEEAMSLLLRCEHIDTETIRRAATHLIASPERSAQELDRMLRHLALVPSQGEGSA